MIIVLLFIFPALEIKTLSTNGFGSNNYNLGDITKEDIGAYIDGTLIFNYPLIQTMNSNTNSIFRKKYQQLYLLTLLFYLLFSTSSLNLLKIILLDSSVGTFSGCHWNEIIGKDS